MTSPRAANFAVCDRNVVVRMIEPTDSLAELTDLLHRAYRPLLDQGLRYLATQQDEETTARRIAKGECYLGLLDGKFVATITVTPPGAASGCPYYERPGVSSFHQYCVDPAMQHHGLGRFLIDLAERRAAELGATEMAIDTAETAVHLIGMYQRRGYKIVDRVDWDVTNYQSVVLAKELSQGAC